ncbi:MAG: glycosyltransferase family 1 protein [Planctomycetota bacterium]
MHIAINCHTLVGKFTGIQRATREMIAALVAADSDCRFTAYVPRKFGPDVLPESAHLVRRASWIPAGNRTLRILWEQFFLPARLQKDGADLFHAPCYVMPLWCRTPTVVTIHDVLAFSHPRFCTRSNRSHFYRILPKTVERAARLVVPSHAVKRAVVDTFTSIRSDKVRVIPWGVSERFRPLAERAEREAAALRLGLPPRYILHVGRNEPKKNIAQAVKAFFAAMLDKKLPHQMVLAGPTGWGVRERERMVQQLGLESRVVCLGYVDERDLPAVYSLADALVFPSLAEGFGFPVLEAMACGTPVIASDIPALSELAEGAAHLVRPGSLPALRNAIETVLTDPVYAGELAARGRERAGAFPWNRHAEAMLQLYDEVLRKG